MHVHVKLFSRLREHLPHEARGEATIDLPDGATLADLLNHLDLVQHAHVVSINDERENDRGRPLRDGDNVRILPFVVGG